MTAEIAKGIGYAGIGDGVADKTVLAKGIAYSLLGPPSGLATPFIFAVLEFMTDEAVVSSNIMTDADVVSLEELMESE